MKIRFLSDLQVRECSEAYPTDPATPGFLSSAGRFLLLVVRTVDSCSPVYLWVRCWQLSILWSFVSITGSLWESWWASSLQIVFSQNWLARCSFSRCCYVSDRHLKVWGRLQDLLARYFPTVGSLSEMVAALTSYIQGMHYSQVALLNIQYAVTCFWFASSAGNSSPLAEYFPVFLDRYS